MKNEIEESIAHSLSGLSVSFSAHFSFSRRRLRFLNVACDVYALAREYSFTER